ncbi:BlaI/MecI/CopY family transcriptional regulator [Labilibacter marinus]|uniref:BlaI/MecI/CopY family transcriptional regulator n=1 Tax=Labilibacter marinus TaxID=1477105 RepID=UPI00094F9338|nr:BlaI/MecI/CopY family transcriptional regulator [Labilibacter marinus]
MKQLTKAEEEIMQILWDKDEAIIKDVVAAFKEKKPAYNTVATVLKVLKTKGFVDNKAVGNTYVYFPIVSKEYYSSHQVKHLLHNYFGGSFARLATFFAKDNNMDIADLEAMLKEAEDSNTNTTLK